MTSHAPITVVSGLPRSGTSMMMRMLAAGGMTILSDGERTADSDNPHGYFELEAVKRTDADPRWLDRARGAAVKVISELLPTLPSGHDYQIVFMRRRIDEVLASQRRMLSNRGEVDDAAGDTMRMKELFVRHLADIESHLRERADMRVVYVSYNRAIEAPAATAERVARFLDAPVDPAAMAGAVDSTLYRNRAG